MTKLKGASLFVSLLAFGLVLLSASDLNAQIAPSTFVSIPAPSESTYNYLDNRLPRQYNERELERADNTPANNRLTNEGAALGRVLFYDTHLSANNTTSCASCHVQANAFTDPDRFSLGFQGGRTGRNSMGLSNARFYENGAFFWDERAATLEQQVLMPIQDRVEMGLTLEQLEANVAAQPYYAELFTDAFGSPDVTSERISLALAQFVRSMVSFDSKYDDGLRNNFRDFTQQEDEGRQLFFSDQTRCSECHTTDLQIGDQARNIGLDVEYADQGVGNVSGDSADNGKFKVPSLRNIAVTGPYMHDGRFETLEQVIAFYNSGIQAHPNLDDRLTQNNGEPIRLNLNDSEQAALAAFLNTLTDTDFLTDPKFSNPFVQLTHQVHLPILKR